MITYGVLAEQGRAIGIKSQSRNGGLGWRGGKGASHRDGVWGGAWVGSLAVMVIGCEVPAPAPGAPDSGGIAKLGRIRQDPGRSPRLNRTRTRCTAPGPSPNARAAWTGD